MRGWRNHIRGDKKQLKIWRVCVILLEDKVAVLKIILTVIFIIISIALTVIILMQEGKSAGLGAIAGAADTYWGKNKGRSMEGRLVTGTKILVVLFIVIAAVLNLGIF